MWFVLHEADSKQQNKEKTMMYGSRTVERDGLKNGFQRSARRAFTLIELLIVIGLLGALTTLILPSLSADREEAMGDVCDYNQSGTVRTLKQYETMTGGYPADMHTGLQDTGSDAEAMEGLPAAQEEHMIDDISDTRLALSSDQADSLEAAGITSVTSGTGLNSDDVAADINVAQACDSGGTNPWNDDADEEMSFDGIDISNWATGSEGPSWNQEGGAGPVVCLWIAPTVNWSPGEVDNKDWSKGAYELEIDLEGQCPIPAEAASGDEVSFSYYMAYFKVFDNGDPARMIGTTCPECGIMNP
ncbi:MAG: type II secretion system protein [Planctomycetota bacterium]